MFLTHVKSFVVRGMNRPCSGQQNQQESFEREKRYCVGGLIRGKFLV